ncbi:MAG: hypothetical protein WC740_19075 [Verrucomicrobiia bacterium]
MNENEFKCRIGQFLLREMNEILAMTVASIKTLRRGAVCQSKIQNPKSKIAQ